MNYASIEEILDALYACISGPAGGQDWGRNAELYHEKALITRTRIEQGKPVAYTFDFHGFRDATIPMLAGRSFYEIETARKIQQFGQIAHVFSAYEARESPDAVNVEFRGINMIHLWHNGVPNVSGRWWIMSIIWDNERDGVEIDQNWFA